MNVYIGSDHRGFVLKERLKRHLAKKGYQVVDCGNVVHDPDDDYPDFCFAVADRVTKEAESLGVVLCGSGGGAVIATNKVPGIRAVIGITPEDVTHNRDHNNANILAIASDFTDFEKAREITTIFLTTPYAPKERFVRRLQKIAAREHK